MPSYSHLPTSALHQALTQLAQESRLSTLVEYVLIEQELKKRLGVTDPLNPNRI